MATASAVLACSVADPYLVLLLEDGSMQLMMVEVGGAEEGSQTRLMQSTPQLGEVRRDHQSSSTLFDCYKLLPLSSSDVQGCVCVCVCGHIWYVHHRADLPTCTQCGRSQSRGCVCETGSV